MLNLTSNALLFNFSSSNTLIKKTFLYVSLGNYGQVGHLLAVVEALRVGEPHEFGVAVGILPAVVQQPAQSAALRRSVYAVRLNGFSTLCNPIRSWIWTILRSLNKSCKFFICISISYVNTFWLIENFHWIIKLFLIVSFFPNESFVLVGVENLFKIYKKWFAVLIWKHLSLIYFKN